VLPPTLENFFDSSSTVHHFKAYLQLNFRNKADAQSISSAMRLKSQCWV
jgi:hypothetical protein